MYRKIVGIFVCMLLIVSTLTAIGVNNKVTDNNINITNCTKGVNRCSEQDFNYINGIDIFNPPTMTIDVEKNIEEPISYDPILIDLPEYFNWKDYDGQDWTTSVKHQGGCGSCWAFAALAALESVINIREGIADLDPDLSEQYVLSCLPTAGGCDGGRTDRAFRWIIDNTSKGNYVNGIIPEACFEYYADDSIPCSNKSLDWEDYLIPVLEYGSVSGDATNIKSTIMEVGPVTAGMRSCENFTNWGATNHNPDDYFPYQEEKNTNHAVIIVGWKDDPSIEKGGYWICKNCWGPTFGYDGFFNIEYESLAIEEWSETWVNYNPDDYDWHPVPKTNGPYYGLVDGPILFQGDAAGEHPPFTWYWDFGDDSTSTEQNPIHSYSNPGEYKVILTVTDDNDKSFYEKTYAWIQETNDPPQTPTIEGPTKIKKGEYCWYNFSFSDPDGNSLYLYVHVFGVESGVWWGPYSGEYGKQNINYYWEQAGEYVVKAKVKDTFGAESDWAILNVTVEKNKSIGYPMISWFFNILIHRFPLFEKILNQIILI